MVDPFDLRAYAAFIVDNVVTVVDDAPNMQTFIHEQIEIIGAPNIPTLTCCNTLFQQVNMSLASLHLFIDPPKVKVEVEKWMRLLGGRVDYTQTPRADATIREVADAYVEFLSSFRNVTNKCVAAVNQTIQINIRTSDTQSTTGSHAEIIGNSFSQGATGYQKCVAQDLSTSTRWDRLQAEVDEIARGAALSAAPIAGAIPNWAAVLVGIGAAVPVAFALPEKWTVFIFAASIVLSAVYSIVLSLWPRTFGAVRVLSRLYKVPLSQDCAVHSLETVDVASAADAAVVCSEEEACVAYDYEENAGQHTAHLYDRVSEHCALANAPVASYGRREVILDEKADEEAPPQRPALWIRANGDVAFNDGGQPLWTTQANLFDAYVLNGAVDDTGARTVAEFFFDDDGISAKGAAEKVKQLVIKYTSDNGETSKTLRNNNATGNYEVRVDVTDPHAYELTLETGTDAPDAFASAPSPAARRGGARIEGFGWYLDVDDKPHVVGFREWYIPRAAVWMEKASVALLAGGVAALLVVAFRDGYRLHYERLPATTGA